MEQEELLIKIAGILEKLNIPYAVTGGIAVSVWGRARFTADIDIAVELFPEKLKDLASELLKIINNIYSADFAPAPGQYICAHCNFRDICDYRI